MPKHPARARHRVRRSLRHRVTFTVTGMLASAAMIGGAAIIGLASAGGSYALWNGAAPVTSNTITSGSLSLTVNTVASYALDGTVWSRMLPGDVVSQQVTLNNTGTTNATVKATATAPSGAIEVRVAKSTCALAGTIGGTSATTSAMLLPGTLAGGASATVCIQVTLSESVAQGQAAPFTLTFTAEQVHP